MPPERRRRLVIDEDLSWRVSAELRARGFRAATSAKERGLANRSMKDPLWLYILSRDSEPFTLLTYDNKMPVVHRDSLIKRASTVAVIDSQADRGGLRVEEYKREVMHRWAHRMALQKAGTVVKYWRTSYRTRNL